MKDYTSETWTEEDQSASEPDFYGKWISVNDKLPEEAQEVLLNVVFSRTVGSMYFEDEIIVSGGFLDGEFFIGNQLVFWDFGYSLGLSNDDITHWMPLPNGPSKETMVE